MKTVSQFLSSQRWPWILLALWLTLALIGVASLSLNHLSAWPGPQSTAELEQQLNQLRTPTSRYLLVHVIAADCSCTQRLYEHLLSRGPFSEAEEIIIFIGEDALKRQQALARGFAYKNWSAQQLAHSLGLEAAPVLMIVDQQQKLRYAGGYFDHPAALYARDQELFQQLRKKQAPTGLPLFGCAVSKQLQQRVDPLGIVYE